jgi:hypothetical protein
LAEVVALKLLSIRDITLKARIIDTGIWPSLSFFAYDEK